MELPIVGNSLGEINQWTNNNKDIFFVIGSFTPFFIKRKGQKKG